MPDIKLTITKVGEAYVVKTVYEAFKLLTTALKGDKGVTLSVKESYKSEYDVIDELRLKVKNKTPEQVEASTEDSFSESATPAATTINSLLDPTYTMSSIVANDEYARVRDYVLALDPEEFEPPIAPSYQGGIAPNTKEVFPYPNKPIVDPRRTGAFVVIEPLDAFKQVEVQKWLINNGAKYGFVLYGDDALFYFGYNTILDKVKSSGNPDETYQGILRRFLKYEDEAASYISTTSADLINFTPPLPPRAEIPNTISIDDLETLQPEHANTLLNNDGQSVDVVLIDGLPVMKLIAPAYLNMRAAAAAEGLTLTITSGFRPDRGVIIYGKGSKGTPYRITPQLVLRSDPVRWNGYVAGTDQNAFAQSKGFANIEDFIMNAPASSFTPETGRPGKSRHGDGTALDVNTGTRRADLLAKGWNRLDSTLYSWLIKNSYKFGFVRTVPTEEWHFEYHPESINGSQGPYTKLPGTTQYLYYNDLSLTAAQFPGPYA